MTIDKQALRERYSPKPVPECHICGEEMTIQRISASRITYGCTGEGNDGYFKFGRTFADEHYEKSRVTVVDVSDPDVLELLDELEHYKSREERVTKLVLDNSTSWDVLYEKLEAAEKRIAEQREYYEGVIADGSKRIAELESKLSKPVLLPKTNGYWTEQEKAYEEAITLAKRQVRLAGFNVEEM
ncbi:ead/Ea22-like family protein [Salmonella enterica]|uniref:Ead/Ea22-like family protein n=1 Tax=Salmonella enterica subsp. enterica serovar 4,[5],12:b:- TaxID=1340177 RepID=A0A730GSD0_SALET|nr:ead/Ea22-like family protein [Salmonella enterica]ECQ5057189.1 ead/Ea22-like family protein [Salmonella enterica subsp. enterica serovar Hartford]ECV2757427.1 ead/Ea22-like family protein [Salmonella enterica subsp. enterica serovar 4,[5],12:b:-]EDR7579141.1 ead/Ea22-like family protein [Salmonella enterica subsp. enterica serovar 4,[5],12:i:-]EAQ7622036.1 ead/Ea22-like family protein [Salmonella enterica]